jgi:hypothetical protein
MIGGTEAASTRLPAGKRGHARAVDEVTLKVRLCTATACYPHEG